MNRLFKTTTFLLASFLLVNGAYSCAEKCTITFNSNGGSNIDSVTVTKGEVIKQPEVDPTKENYTFYYWSKYQNGKDEEGALSSYDFASRVNESFTLFAQYKGKPYTVTFDYNFKGKSEYSTKTVNYGELIPPITNPSIEYYDFNGWYKESECINKWDFAKDVVNGDTYLYAKWSLCKHTVNFNTTEYGTIIEDQEVEHGGHITKPDNPVIKGYEEDIKFYGWYKDVEFNDPWDFDTDVVTEDTTLYAKYEFTGVIVCLYRDIEKQDCIYQYQYVGNKIIKPSNPTKEGYTFDGSWYDDKDKSKAKTWNFDSDTIPKTAEGKYFCLYAGWNINKYTVSFDTQGHGGEVPEINDVEYNSTFDKPTDPKEDGYYFRGWYKESECVNKWDFENDRMPANDLTLYAKWDEYSFASDSWSTIIDNAKGGLDNLHAVYKKDCDNNKSYPGTLIGLEKNVDLTVDDDTVITHKVRVIGENQDVDKEGNKVALTFEFVNVLSTKTKDAKPIIWGQSNIWSSSNIRSYMSTIRLMLPDELKSGIKKVSKDVYDYPSSSLGVDELYLFPLTVKEMGYSPVYAKETFGPYKYYKDCSSQVHSKRIKKDVNGNAASYWTRSVYSNSKISDYTWYSDANSVLTHCPSNRSFGIAPAFCI